MTTVQDILNILTQIAADQLAESWDNVGLLIGEARNPATTILLALDPTLDLLDQAQTIGAELIITHHPAIFRPLKSLRTDQPVGRFVAAVLKHNVSVIGCHTNLDATIGGVSDVLARAMGVINPVPLVPGSGGDNGCGLGRIGALEQPLSADAFTQQIYRAISAPWLLEAGPRPEMISRVAVCGGSCSDLAETALLAGADVFITSEVKHDVARWAEEAGLWIIDGGHFATENPAMPVLQQLLSDRLQAAALDAQIHIGRQQAPLQLIQPQNNI